MIHAGTACSEDHRHGLCWPAVLASLFLAGWSMAASGDGVLFDAMDVFELEYASEPRVAPGSSRLVYLRNGFDIMTDRKVTTIWQLDLQGGDHRQLDDGLHDYGSPRWSPDGDRLLFTASAPGEKRPGIYLRWMDTGQRALLVVPDQPASSITWSPDGRWIAFTMNVKARPEPLVPSRKPPEGAKWAESARVIDTVRYQYDGKGIVETQYRHVFVVSAEGGTPRQLTQGHYNHDGPLSWAPDSGSLLFSANRHADHERETIEEDIFSVDIETGEMRQLTDEPGAEANPVYSPDGRFIAFLKSRNEPVTYRNRRLAVMEADGSKRRSLTENLDASVSQPVWRQDSRGLYFRYDQRADRRVALTKLDGKRSAVVSGLGGTTLGRPYLSGSFHSAGDDVIAYTTGTPDRPADIAVVSKGHRRVLTDLNGDLLDHRKLARIHEVNYRSSFDGQPIQGWYLTPPGFVPAGSGPTGTVSKYPMILEIHGGPHLAYGPYFSAEMQLMAAAGYIVFYDNYRGSASYGEDFARLLQYRYASKEDFADHMSGVDAMLATGLVDENNLFIAGGSAGGIGTAYAIGLTHRFKAAVAAKPVINWISKTLTADSSVSQIRHQFPDYPWKAFGHYWKRSPLSLVANVSTPTMLLTGEEDRRTPISETEQFYQALKLLGVDAVMVRLPGSYHGIASRPSRLIAKVDYLLAWFERYRTDKGEVSATMP